MFSRTAAILLAVLGLYACAFQAAAAPRGWGGRGGGFRGGFVGGGWGPRAGGPRGGWGVPGGYPGAFGGGRMRGYPAPMPGEGYGGYPATGPDAYGRRPYAPPPASGFAGAPRAFGQGGGAFQGDWRAEQDEVRRAVREGRHIPLNQAIEAVRRRTPGRELNAGLEAGPDGRSVYRLRWAGQDGRRQDYLVDAGSGAIVGVQGGP